MNEEELFQQALGELDGEMPDAPHNPNDPNDPTSDQAFKDRVALMQADQQDGGGRVARTLRSIGTGTAKALFETKDFLFGEPKQDEKSDFRQYTEGMDRALGKESAGYSVTSGISQMVTGLLGAGKLMAPLKALKWFQSGGKVAKAGYEIAKGASAGAVVIDPHEERLSNLVESFPSLQNPVTEYLAANPDDSAAEGRFKNALESIGVDLALVGVVKTIKAMRMGDQELAKREIAKMARSESIRKAAFEANQGEFGMDFMAGDKDVSGFRNLYAERHAKQKASASKSATEPRTDSPASVGTNTAANLETPPSEPPRVKESGIDITTSSSSHMEATDEQLASILTGTRDELEAIQKYGSREAATEAGQIMRQGQASLPWQKLRTTDEVASFMDNATRVLKAQMDGAKGGAILSDAKVNSMVEARAALFGEDPAIVIGQLRQAGDAAKDMVADMEAGYLIGTRMMGETYSQAFRIVNGMEADAVKAGAELKARLLASADFMEAAQSISSNSGRALRRMRGQFKFTPELLAKVKDMDGQDLARLISQTKGDPKLLAQTVNPTFLQRAMDEASFSLTNSLLWSYPTHVVNTASNLYMLVGRPTEKLLGSLAISPKDGSNLLRQKAIKEYSYTVAALSDAWSALKDAFVKGDSILSPHNTEFFQNGSSTRIIQQPIKWKPVATFGDLQENAWTALTYRNVVGLPTRTLGAVDEFFKTLRYRAYVQAEAATKASMEGLKGWELHRFVEQELEKAIDPASGVALNQRALREAQVATFQQELLSGTWGATIQQNRSRHPVLTFVLPFVKTPVNVLRYAVKMTPGLNLLQTEFRDAMRGVTGEEAKAHAIGQMTLGSTFMGLSALLAVNGKITGSGPSDPRLQEELKATGWQPHSYVITRPDGTKRYIPLGRVDPAGMAFSMVADLVDLMRNDPDSSSAETGIDAVLMTLAKNFTDRTFLQNIHQALEAVSDTKGDRGEKYLASLAGNTIPLSSAMKSMNPDPYLREARSFIDGMLKNVPGYSKTLPAKRDAFGDPIFRTIGLSTTTDGDIVEAEHNRIIIETGKAIGRPSPKFEGVDLRDIILKSGQNAYERFQELSGHLPKEKPLKEILGKIIKSESYQDMSDGDPDVKGTRLNALSKYVQKYREAARKVLIRENPELQQLIKARQKAALGAIIKNRSGDTNENNGARVILDALSAH